MTAQIHTTTDETFDTQVYRVSHETPVLVDFWADWCQPCKQLGAMLEKVAPAFSDRVRVVKVDADQNPVAAHSLGVRGLPFLAFVRDGLVQATQAGAMTESQLRSWLDEQLGG